MTPTPCLIPKSVFNDWRNVINQLESQNRHLRKDLNDAQEQLVAARDALQKLQDHGFIDEYIAWFKREYGHDPMLHNEPVAIKFARHLLAPIRNGYQPRPDGRTPNPPPSEP